MLSSLYVVQVGGATLLGADGGLASAGILLAAAPEAVGARLEESSAGGADGGIRLASLDRVGLRADGSLSSTGILLAATTETVGARLEEASAGGADGRVGLAGLDCLGLGADRGLSGTGVGLAAAAEAVGARLEEAGARSADGGIGLADLDLHGLDGLVGAGLVVGAPGDAAGLSLAAASEAVVGAHLETAQAGGADVAGRVGAGVLGRLGGGGRDLGDDGGGGGGGGLLGGSGTDGLTGLELEVGAPGNGAGVDTAVATEVVVAADVVGSGTRTLGSPLNSRTSGSKASNGEDGDKDGMHLDVGDVLSLWYEGTREEL